MATCSPINVHTRFRGRRIIRIKDFVIRARFTTRWLITVPPQLLLQFLIKDFLLLFLLFEDRLLEHVEFGSIFRRWSSIFLPLAVRSFREEWSLAWPLPLRSSIIDASFFLQVSIHYWLHLTICVCVFAAGGFTLWLFIFLALPVFLAFLPFFGHFDMLYFFYIVRHSSITILQLFFINRHGVITKVEPHMFLLFNAATSWGQWLNFPYR